MVGIFHDIIAVAQRDQQQSAEPRGTVGIHAVPGLIKVSNIAAQSIGVSCDRRLPGP